MSAPLCRNPHGARSLCTRDVVVLVGAGVDHDVLARVARVDRASRFDAVATRHADVHQHDVGLVLLTQPNRLVPVGRAPRDDEAAVALEHLLDERGEWFVVLADDDA